jgi:hypothetical protein
MKKKKQEKKPVRFDDIVRESGRKFAKDTLYGSVGSAEFFSKEKNR